MNTTRNDKLQALCRDYLGRLRVVASKYGLLPQLDNLIAMNQRGECSGTEEEVSLLARACDDERVSANGLTKLLGLSYRYCYENNIFDKIKRLRQVGTYSKVDAMLCEVELATPPIKKKRIRHKNWIIV